MVPPIIPNAKASLACVGKVFLLNDSVDGKYRALVGLRSITDREKLAIVSAEDDECMTGPPPLRISRAGAEFDDIHRIARFALITDIDPLARHEYGNEADQQTNSPHRKTPTHKTGIPRCMKMAFRKVSGNLRGTELSCFVSYLPRGSDGRRRECGIAHIRRRRA